MPNRVTPFGVIVPIDQRGLFMGNRGCIHRGRGEIARRWQVRRWITCALEHKGWVAPKWVPGRWTALFFWDEAVALAAGHRPCALCRHTAYTAWLDAWEAAFGERLRADPMDRVLHTDRLDGRIQRRHRAAWDRLPDGVFVAVDLYPDLGLDLSGPGARSRGGDATTRGAAVVGSSRGGADGGVTPGRPGWPGAVAALVLDDRIVPWSAAGYGPPVDRPASGDATVLTPRSTVEVIRYGYRPQLHPSVTDRP